MSGAPVVPAESLYSFCISVVECWGEVILWRSFVKKECLAEVSLSLACPTAFPNNIVIGWNTQWPSPRGHGTHKTQEDSHVFLGTDECLRWNSFWFKSLSNVAMWRMRDPSVFCVNLNFPVENTHFLSTWPASKFHWCHSFGFYLTSFYPECSGMKGSHPTLWDSIS